MSNTTLQPVSAAVAAAPIATGGLWRGPLAYRDYRWFFLGISFLSMGVWVGDPAMRWLVQELTGSPVWVGAVGFCASFPILVFSLPGGVMADRMNRVLLFSIGRGVGALLMLALGVGVALQAVTVWHVLVLAFLVGTLVAIEIPGRQAIMPNLVPRDHLMSAVALSAGVWSASLMIGPAIAGWIINLAGTAWCFAAAGVLQAIAVVAFLPLRHATSSDYKRAPTESPWVSLMQGLRYIRHHEVIFGLIVMTVVCTVLGQPATQALLPSLADNVMGRGAEVYGLMLTGMGAGSAIANIGLAWRRHWPRRGRMVFVVAALLAGTSLAISAVRTPEAAFPVALLQGMMQASLLTLTSTLVQATVAEEMRGRVLSAYMLTWGFTAGGSLFFGSVAGAFSVPVALATAGVLLLAALMVVRAKLPAIWELE